VSVSNRFETLFPSFEEIPEQYRAGEAIEQREIW